MQAGPPPSVRSSSYGQIEIAPEIREIAPEIREIVPEGRSGLKSHLKRKSFRTLQEHSEDLTRA